MHFNCSFICCCYCTVSYLLGVRTVAGITGAAAAGTMFSKPNCGFGVKVAIIGPGLTMVRSGLDTMMVNSSSSVD